MREARYAYVLQLLPLLTDACVFLRGDAASACFRYAADSRTLIPYRF